MIRYTDPAIIEQRKTLVLQLCRNNNDAQSERIADALCEKLGEYPYSLIECDQPYDTVWATSINDALTEARDNFSPLDYDFVESSRWIDIGARNLVTGELDSETVTIEPDEPECEGDRDHEWETPYSVLGGCKENPGVCGHGGGVIITEVCAHCGRYRVTDTWAQRMDTGEQGLTSVSFEDADEKSMAWVQRRLDR